jgi:5-methylcytosine-specific restriction endonuclease McrA
VGTSPSTQVACLNPDCKRPVIKIGYARTQKYCCYQCGDKVRSKRYREKHPDRIKVKIKLNWIINRKKLSRRYRKWRKGNAPYWKSHNRMYRAIKGAEYWREYWRGWYQKNRFEWAGRVTNRRALLSSRVSPSEQLTWDQWIRLIIIWRGRCVYCGCMPDVLTQDHVIPLSRGGTHTMDNIVPACKPCNSSKGNKDVDEWLYGL